MENEKWKMENDCVRFAHDLKLFPKEIPQFSIFNFQFSIAQQLAKLKFEAHGLNVGKGGENYCVKDISFVQGAKARGQNLYVLHRKTIVRLPIPTILHSDENLH